MVWKKDTWGSYGQHSNVYVFVIDVDALEQKPIFKCGVVLRHVNMDSRKNLHRYTYVRIDEIVAKLKGKILKVVFDYASSRRRTVTVKYFIVTESGLEELEYTTGLRDEQGFFDEIKLPDGRTLIVRKDRVEVRR